jgi:hypothetical protein
MTEKDTSIRHFGTNAPWAYERVSFGIYASGKPII